MQKKASAVYIQLDADSSVRVLEASIGEAPFIGGGLRSANLHNVTPCITPWQPDVSATGGQVMEKSDIHKSLNPFNEISQGQQEKRGKLKGLQRWKVKREMSIFSGLYYFIQHRGAEP